MIDAWSEPVPWNGDRRPRAQLAIARFERRQHAAHPRDRVAPFLRPAAVRGAAARDDLEPREALVADREPQVGRLGDDRRIRAPVAHERLGAEALVLLVHDGGDNEPARASSRARACAAAAIIAATPPFMSCAPRPYSRPSCTRGVERLGHALDADGVEVAAEHQRRVPASRPSSTPMTFGRPGSDLLHDDIQAGGRHGGARDFGGLGLAGRAGHERRVDGIRGDEVAKQRQRIHGLQSKGKVSKFEV